jgi:hypothetical protein
MVTNANRLLLQPSKLAKALPTELTKYIDFYVDYRKYEIKDTSRRNLMLLSIKWNGFKIQKPNNLN